MENCPFCGTKVLWSQGQTTEFECYTIITETGLDPTRGKECLIKQSAQQTALLQQVKEIVQRIGNRSGSSCPICTGGINGWGHTMACHDLQALLPALERVK